MKQIVAIDSKRKKDRTVFTSSAQVYGGQSSEKTTKTGLFKNTSCTFMRVVVALFTAMSERTRKTRAVIMERRRGWTRSSEKEVQRYSKIRPNAQTSNIPESRERATDRGRDGVKDSLQPVTNLALSTLILAAIIATPAQAQTISNDRGGHVIVYALKVAKLRQSGEQVRITGRCDSACTVYLGLPAGQICVTPGAFFGFHKPYGASQQANREAEAHLMRNYPQWVRSWIAGRGGLTGKLITMNYSTAAKHIRRCV